MNKGKVEENKKKDNTYEQLTAVAENTKETFTVFTETIEKYVETKDIAMEFANSQFRNVVHIFSTMGNRLEQTLGNLQGTVNRFLDAMSEKRDISSSNFKHISNLFVITCLFLIISGFGAFVGSYLAAYILSYFLLDTGAILLILIVIPISASNYFHSYNIKSLADDHRRGIAACFVFEQAVLIGFLNQNHFFDSPYTIFVQVIASFAYPLAITRTSNRLQVFGVVAGAIIALNLLQSIFFSTLSIGFILMIAVYALLAVGLIQYTLEFRQKEDFDDIQVTMHYTFMIAAVKMIGLYCFGVPSDQYSVNK